MLYNRAGVTDSVTNRDYNNRDYMRDTTLVHESGITFVCETLGAGKVLHPRLYSRISPVGAVRRPYKRMR